MTSSQSVNGRFHTELKPLTSRHSVWPPCHTVLTSGMHDHLSPMTVNESFDWSWYHSLITTPTHLAGGQVNQHPPCWGTGEPALTLLGDRWSCFFSSCLNSSSSRSPERLTSAEAKACFSVSRVSMLICSSIWPTHTAIRSIHRDLSWMSPRRTGGINLCSRQRQIW